MIDVTKFLEIFSVLIIAKFVFTSLRTNTTNVVFRQVSKTRETIAIAVSFLNFSYIYTTSYVHKMSIK